MREEKIHGNTKCVCGHRKSIHNEKGICYYHFLTNDPRYCSCEKFKKVGLR